MKSIKRIALSAFLTVSAFCAVLYTSCSKDECKDVVCQNGGVCASGTCTCVSGYEGANCETAVRAKFIKSWSAADLISGGTSPLAYTANIVAGTGTDMLAVVIGNSFSDNFFTVGPIKATVSGNTITIPLQNPDGNKYSLSGSGTIASGKITWSYTIKNDLTSATQLYSGTWQ